MARAPQSGRLTLALLLLFPPGCRATVERPSPPPVSLPPGLGVHARAWAGTSLTGPRPVVEAPPDPALAPPLRVELTLLALAELPDLGVPLGSTSRMVLAPEAEEPIEVFPHTMAGGHLLEGELAAAFVDGLASLGTSGALLAAAWQGPLIAGTTTSLAVATVEIDEDPENFLGEFRTLGPVLKQVDVAVARTGAGLEAAIGMVDLAEPGGEDLTPLFEPDRDELRPGAPLPRREVLLTRVRPEADGAPLVFLVPSPFVSGRGAGYAAVVRVHTVAPEDTADHERRVAGALARLEALAPPPRRQERPRAADAPRGRALVQALEALDPDSGVALRAPLVFLADVGDAPFAGDLALVADDELLEQWVDELRAQARPRGDEPDAVDRLGWMLDRGAYLLVARRALRGSLPDELGGLLLHHAGELGRFPSLLSAAATRSAGAADFQRRLVEENRQFLDDSNPTARVRAHEWLERQGLAPAGYDPLASREERRAILEPTASDSSTEERP